jgi:hypothetical protein
MNTDTIDDLDDATPGTHVAADAGTDTTDDEPDDKGAAAEATDDDPDDLAVEVEHGGQKTKMAPLSKLIAHRTKAREAATRASTAESERDALKHELDTLRAGVAEVAPIINAVKNNPKLLEMAMGKTAPSSTTNATNDDPAEGMAELAKEWELYDADGRPDAARATRIYKAISTPIMDAARKEADAKVAPILNERVSTKAAANKAQLHQWEKEGHIPKGSVEKVFKTFPVPDDMLAHDGVRDAMFFMARGMNAEQAKAAAGVDDAVLHTELPGGRGRRPAELPKFARDNAERRGKSVAEWSKLRDDDSNVLE